MVDDAEYSLWLFPRQAVIDAGYGKQQYDTKAVDAAADYPPYILIERGYDDAGKQGDQTKPSAHYMGYHIKKLFASRVFRQRVCIISQTRYLR